MKEPTIILKYLPLKSLDDAAGKTVEKITSIGAEESTFIIFTDGTALITSNEYCNLEVIEDVTSKFSISELLKSEIVSKENAEKYEREKKEYKEYVGLYGDAGAIRSFIEINPSDMGHCLNGGAVLNKCHLAAYELILKNRPLVETIYLEIMGVPK